MNTLDASNAIVYLGIIFQPGRTEDHNLRMSRLQKETEIIETQNKIMEGNLTLLQKQIEFYSIRLEHLQKSSNSFNNREQETKSAVLFATDFLN